MLVLTRKKGQALVIGSNIRVVVVDVSGDYVRIGIDAPLEVPVYREELYRELQEENRASMVSRKVITELEKAMEK
ncbi:carbon storage regulator CsrA [Desulfovirgula thermocuniculi]|uniref:carbon storage regulator CsrA n=1 Tax=Desulfovirgula thermocuniculi TaxID=348842 RepID=UPI000423F842|nr:carbon storage regulator CsrA [Desulfovirgula thermocuniculi]